MSSYPFLTRQMNHEFVVGKYTLESLTNGMYSSPLDLYREYIQNAVDSIDEAIAKHIVRRRDTRIDITIDTENSQIIIRDNGCGISSHIAARMLIDIGNSKKNRMSSRGFRGIGRLAGLGYCDTLTFITSADGEDVRSTISFDAAHLKQMLIPGSTDDGSIYDVIDAVVTQSQEQEKINSHYFEVVMTGVSLQNELASYENVETYLTQNAPLPFHPEFQWGHTVRSKVEIAGYKIPAYNIYLNYNGKSEKLYKPYRDLIVSDRVKKLDDNIHDIQTRVFGDPKRPLAILWYASTNFYGTIIDPAIKGLRIRQGNILIGNNTTCAHFFKEERFNGWVIGEIHVVDPSLIANSRRDNFEQNDAYFELAEEARNCAAEITKELRRLSNSRSLSAEKKAVLEAETIDDVNGLSVEDMDFACESSEYFLMNVSDGDLEAENDFINKLSMILDQKNRQTKYTAININDKLTVEQRKVLERVFDVISQTYEEREAQKFINLIAMKF